MDNCSNSLFSGRFRLTDGQNLSVGILLAFTSFFVFLINIILVLAIVKTHQLVNYTHIYILCLSVSDCIQGAITAPSIALLFIVYHTERNCVLSNAVQAFALFSTHLSGYFILLIAFDRYMNIRTEFTEDNCFLKRLKTKIGSVTLTSICFITSFAHAGISFPRIKYKRHLTILMGILDFISIITVYVLYIRIYLKVRKHFEGNVVYEDRNVNKEETGNSRRYLTELAKTVFLILIPLAVCYSPFTALYFYMLNFSNNNVSLTLQYIYYLFMLPVFFNGILDSCIVLCRNEELCGYLRRKLLCFSLLGITRSDGKKWNRNNKESRINESFNDDTAL